MHLAYIISAYRVLRQVDRLVRALAGDTTRFLVHVDKKTSDQAFDDLVRASSDVPSVSFLDRHTCHYGGFGHVRATLKGIDHLVRGRAPFDYAVLLTGQDYPIKPVADIHAFFERHEGASFMAHRPLPSPYWSPRGGLDRIEYRHFRLRGRHLRLPGKRTFPPRLRPFGGGAYWCLSRACIEYVSAFVARRPDVVRFFTRVDVPDETFFQTIVMNSHLAETVVDDNLRYIDWSRGVRPANLGLGDLEELRRTPKLYARKFDITHDAAVLDAIDRELLGVSR